MPLHPSITPIYGVYILNHKNPLTWNKTNHCTIVTPVPIMIPVSSQWGRNNLAKKFYIRIYIYAIAIFQYSIISIYSNTTGIESIQLTSFSSHRACRRAQWPWRNSHFPRQAKLAPGSKLGRFLNAWIDQDMSWRCNWQDGSNALTNGLSKDRLWGKKWTHGIWILFSRVLMVFLHVSPIHAQTSWERNTFAQKSCCKLTNGARHRNNLSVFKKECDDN